MRFEKFGQPLGNLVRERTLLTHQFLKMTNMDRIFRDQSVKTNTPNIQPDLVNLVIFLSNNQKLSEDDFAPDID